MIYAMELFVRNHMVSNDPRNLYRWQAREEGAPESLHTALLS